MSALEYASRCLFLSKPGLRLGSILVRTGCFGGCVNFASEGYTSA